MKSQKVITFQLDSLEWTGGVADNFANTPLGILSKPIGIERIAELEWTIMDENIITIFTVEPETQLKYWLKIPGNVRDKITKFTHDILPFENDKIFDRHLLGYSSENPINGNKYIGFIFESILTELKIGLYVYMQAKINFNDEAKKFMENYIEEINSIDIKNLEQIEIRKESRFKKLLSLFRKS